MPDMPTYRYLQLENGWPSFALSGVQADADGTLTLARVPTLGDGGAGVPVPGLDGPMGIGVDPCGDLYVADPAHHRIIRIDACDGSATPLGCLAGPGAEPGQLTAPRGVIVGPRRSLYIADSGNGRVVVVDLDTGQLRAIWGDASGSTLGGAGAPAPGRFIQPWDLAADRAGHVYVADPGRQDSSGRWSDGRVQKFTSGGAVIPAFDAAVRAQPRRPGAPAGITVAMLDAGDPSSERLLVLDRQPPGLLAYALDGTFDPDATTRWSEVVGARATPAGVAVGDGVLYVADAATGQVLVFGTDGAFHGVARGSTGATAGIALDCHGRLLVHPGGSGTVQRADGVPSFSECGTFLAGPFDAASEPTRWQRLDVTMDPLPEGAHLQLFTLTSNTLDGSPGRRPNPPAVCGALVAPLAVSASDPAPAPLEQWRPAPWDAGDVLALNAPARYLWIAGLLQGDGTVTPAVRQIRLTHDEEGWLRFLPAIYARNDTSRVFLERALAAFERVLGIEGTRIDDLPLLFDAWAAPDEEPHPTWLEWLAAWVDAGLREQWPDDVRRRVVAQAFTSHGRRGTLESIRRAVALYTGATPFIEELGNAAPWSLGVSTSLGFDTVLAPEPAQGAVVGTTALVDRSHLIADEEIGAPVFEDVAHRFAVQVYAADLTGSDPAQALARVRDVLDREKPAHTTYHLCTIGPRMRVGFQARVGIDAVVGGAPEPGALDGARQLGTDTVLGGTPPAERIGSRIGGARLGAHATLA
jgi:phage tail-like protein